LQAAIKGRKQNRPTIEEARKKYELARKELVERNMRLVGSMAKRYAGRGLPLEDVIEDGYVGLMIAVDKFDPTHGTTLGTYARWWIRLAMERGIYNDARPIRMPAHVESDLAKFAIQRGKLTAVLGRPPTAEEVTNALRWDPARIKRIGGAVKLTHLYELDRPRMEDEKATLMTLIKDKTQNTEARIEQRELREALLDALKLLKSKGERRVLCLRFGIGETTPLNLPQIAELYGLSRERIRQIEERAIEKLRRSGNPRMRVLSEFLEETQ